MDIPIDPALLEEEGGFEDAEGEIDEEYIDANVCVLLSPLYEFVDDAFAHTHTSKATSNLNTRSKIPTCPNTSTSRAHLPQRVKSPSLPHPSARSVNRGHQLQSRNQEDHSMVSTVPFTHMPMLTFILIPT